MEQWSSITSGSSLWSCLSGVPVPFQWGGNVGRLHCDLLGLLFVWMRSFSQDKSPARALQHINWCNKQELEAPGAGSSAVNGTRQAPSGAVDGKDKWIHETHTNAKLYSWMFPLGGLTGSLVTVSANCTCSDLVSLSWRIAMSHCLPDTLHLF